MITQVWGHDDDHTFKRNAEWESELYLITFILYFVVYMQ